VRQRLEEERHAAAVSVAAALQNQIQFAGRQQEVFDEVFVRVRRLKRRIVLAQASPPEISENWQNRQFSGVEMSAPAPAEIDSTTNCRCQTKKRKSQLRTDADRPRVGETAQVFPRFAHVILLDVRCLSRGQLVLVLLGVMRAIASERIGDIEFFGHKGLDVERIRASLPVHEGEEYSDRTKSQVREAVAAAIGKQPTDVAAICCDENGNRLLFIGLPGASYKGFRL